MRYLPINQVPENSILATPVFNDHGNVYLNANCVLKRAYLDRLKEYGFVGLYIYDDISDTVVVKQLLSEELRIATVRALKTLNLDACRIMAHNIVDELLNHSDISLDMVNISSFDSYTYLHCMNVAVLSVIVGLASGMTDEQLRNISQAALLHDLGKLCIDPEILNKSGPLTDEEMEIMKAHPEEGYKMVKSNALMPSVVKNAILCHHENEDGSGYPRGISGNEIHPFSKIIHVCDVYDALVSKRVYRDALNPAEALEYLMSNCGVMFDMTYVQKLMKYVAPYPTGITVELSNGKQALITQQNATNRTRPKVVLLDTREEVDLMEVFNLTILKILT